MQDYPIHRRAERSHSHGTSLSCARRKSDESAPCFQGEDHYLETFVCEPKTDHLLKSTKSLHRVEGYVFFTRHP